jgi:hypothetical protein
MTAVNRGLSPMIAESNPALLESEWDKKVYDAGTRREADMN